MLNIKQISILFFILWSACAFGQPLCSADSCITVSFVQIVEGSITEIEAYQNIGASQVPCGYENISLYAQSEGQPDAALTWSFVSNDTTKTGNNYACIEGCPSGAGFGIDTINIAVEIDSLTTCACQVILTPPDLPTANDIDILLCDDDEDGMVNDFDDLTIYNDSINADTSVNITYHFDAATANDNINSITNPFDVNASDTLYARVSDKNTDCFSIAKISFSFLQNPDIQIIANFPTLTCINDSITLQAIVDSEAPFPYIYNWVSIDESITTTEHDTFSIRDAGNYRVIVNAGGCTDIADIDIGSDFTAPQFSSNPIDTPDGTQLDCEQNPLILIANASSSNGDSLLYQWTTNNGNIYVNHNLKNTRAISTGIYTVTVTQNTNGCSAQESITITAATDSLNLSIVPSDTLLTCYQPTITLTASSTANMPRYLWNTGDTTTIIMIDMAGTYSVSMTDDSNACSTSEEVVIIADNSPPTVSNDTLYTCDYTTGIGTFNLTNASITTDSSVFISYHVQLSDAMMNDNSISYFTNYSSAESTVFARVENDNNGCFTIAEIALRLSELEVPDILFAAPVDSLCAMRQITTVQIKNPRPDYIYTWGMNSIDTTNVIDAGHCTALELAGNVDMLTLTIQSNNCITTQEYPVNRTTSPSMSAEILRLGPTNILFCNRNDFNTYQWGRESKTDLCPQVIEGAIYQDYLVENIDTDNYYYWLIVEDEAGCTRKIYYQEDPFRRMAQNPDIDYGKLTMQVAPNPNKGTFEITLTGNEDRALDLYLYDSFGREISYQQMDKLDVVERISLSFPSLPSGVYFIQMTSSSDINIVEKIVIY